MRKSKTKTHRSVAKRKQLDGGGAPRASKLIEFTPVGFRKCTYGPSCPAVFVDDKEDNYVIIGNYTSAGAFGISHRVSADEKTIVISAELLEEAVLKARRLTKRRSRLRRLGTRLHDLSRPIVKLLRSPFHAYRMSRRMFKNEAIWQ